MQTVNRKTVKRENSKHAVCWSDGLDLVNCTANVLFCKGEEPENFHQWGKTGILRVMQEIWIRAGKCIRVIKLQSVKLLFWQILSDRAVFNIYG
jgi:hypothetical protein